MQIRSRAKTARTRNAGLNARYTCAAAALAQMRIAITAGNFARNSAVIQFGRDLLGVKPNSKSRGGPAGRPFDSALPSSPVRISSVARLMNRSLTTSAGIEAGEIRDESE